MSSLNFAIKRGDTYPSLQLNVTGLPAMTDATVVFIARNHNAAGDPEINAEASFVSPNSLVYAWDAADTAELADWDAEFEVTLSTGKVFTVPGATAAGSAQYMRVKVVADLGDAEETVP